MNQPTYYRKNILYEGSDGPSSFFLEYQPKNANEIEPKYGRQISRDVFLGSLMEFVSTGVLYNLSKSNRDLRQVYLHRVLSMPYVWAIAINTNDVELLDLIKDLPILDDIDSLDVYFESSLDSDPEFVYLILNQFGDEDFKKLVTRLKELGDMEDLRFAQAIAKKPEILDLFAPYIDKLTGILSPIDLDLTKNILNIVLNKLGYIPRRMFDQYLGYVLYGCYDEMSAIKTGSCLRELISSPSSSFNLAMEYQPYVK